MKCSIVPPSIRSALSHPKYQQVAPWHCPPRRNAQQCHPLPDRHQAIQSTCKLLCSTVPYMECSIVLPFNWPVLSHPKYQQLLYSTTFLDRMLDNTALYLIGNKLSKVLASCSKAPSSKIEFSTSPPFTRPVLNLPNYQQVAPQTIFLDGMLDSATLSPTDIDPSKVLVSCSIISSSQMKCSIVPSSIRPALSHPKYWQVAPQCHLLREMLDNAALYLTGIEPSKVLASYSTKLSLKMECSIVQPSTQLALSYLKYQGVAPQNHLLGWNT